MHINVTLTYDERKILIDALYIISGLIAHIYDGVPLDENDAEAIKEMYKKPAEVVRLSGKLAADMPGYREGANKVANIIDEQKNK